MASSAVRCTLSDRVGGDSDVGKDARVCRVANSGVVNRPANLQACWLCFVHAGLWGKLSRCAHSVGFNAWIRCNRTSSLCSGVAWMIALLLGERRPCRWCLWNRNAGRSATVDTGKFAVRNCNGHAIAACSDAMRSTIAVPTLACE